jgi:hypothetical protein
MIYSIAEEFIRVFKHIDIDFNLGLSTSLYSNQSLFKVYYDCLPNKIISYKYILVRTIAKWCTEDRIYIYLFYGTWHCSFVRLFFGISYSVTKIIYN